jgi:O-antigen/teichoic acid export membrane protein
MFVLPFLITELISAASNAAWYVAWMMAMAIWFVPNSVGYSLQARLARPGLSAHDEAEEIRGALRSATLLAVAAAVGVAVVGPLLLHVMGPVYQSATRALWVLCIAVLPTIFSEVWLAACRVRRRWRLPIALYAVVGCSVLGGAMVIAHRGIADVAVLWLAAQVVIGSCAWWSLHTELRRPRANSSVRGRFLARASS